MSKARQRGTRGEEATELWQRTLQGMLLLVMLCTGLHSESDNCKRLSYAEAAAQQQTAERKEGFAATALLQGAAVRLLQSAHCSIRRLC